MCVCVTSFDRAQPSWIILTSWNSLSTTAQQKNRISCAYNYTSILSLSLTLFLSVAWRTPRKWQNNQLVDCNHQLEEEVHVALLFLTNRRDTQNLLDRGAAVRMLAVTYLTLCQVLVQCAWCPLSKILKFIRANLWCFLFEGLTSTGSTFVSHSFNRAVQRLIILRTGPFSVNF